MYGLRTYHPQTQRELEAACISVTNKDVSFVFIVADHACEHLNNLMKVISKMPMEDILLGWS
jgi:hypothetical protein